VVNGEMNPLQFGKLMAKVESLEQGQVRVEEDIHAIRETLDKLVVAEATRTAADKISRRWSNNTMMVVSAAISGLVALGAGFIKRG
jgi:hypothetical protein